MPATGAVIAASIFIASIVATIEAMKMEAAITAPVAGTVARLAVPEATPVQAGDLLLVIG